MTTFGVGNINSDSSYQSLTDSRVQPEPRYTRHRLAHYWPRIFRTKGALAVVFWHLLINVGFQATHYPFNEFSRWAAQRNLAFHGLVYSTLFLLSAALCPLYGFLADVYFGRHRILQLSSIFFVIGMVFGEANIVLRVWNIYSNETVVALILELPCIVLTLLCFISAKSIMFTFGMDQIKNPSSDELSSYVFWWVWVEVLSITMGTAVFTSLQQYVGHGMIIFAFTNVVVGLMVAIFLIINKCCIASLYFNDPVGAGSYKMVAQVVRFAAMNRYPLKRSAWTYCEDEEITRLDLGKSRYGGPFTTEQVENVKTLFRLLLIIGACSASSIGFLAASNENIIFLFLQHMQWHSVAVTQSLKYCPDIVVLVIFPAFEALGLPYLRRWIPSILKRLGLTIVLSLIATSSFIAIGDMIDNNEVTCMFGDISNSSLNDSAVNQSDTNGYILLLPLTMNSIAFTLFRFTTVELLVAQSPSHFRIILIGLLYTMKGIREFAFEALILVFRITYRSLHHGSSFSCGTIFYLSAFCIGVCGLVLYCISAKKYKYRRRDDVTVNEHMYAEEYFTRDSPSS